MSDFSLPALIGSTFVAGGEYHHEISSTNDRLRELAGKGDLPLPLLVVAERQTAGRGRGANRWWTGEGSLACSLLIEPGRHGIERRHCNLLSLAAALGVVQAVRPHLAGHCVGLHWPNDVYVGSRKLAGILVEALADGRHIIGIGINVNNPISAAPIELSDLATSLRELTGQQQSRQEVLRSVLDRLEHLLEQLGVHPDTIGQECDAHCLQHDQVLSIEQGRTLSTGRCRGVAADGALLLATERGIERFYAGVLRRSPGA